MKPNETDLVEEYCRELLDVLLPALRFRARACGYAIGVHGSLRRDIDLIAVPWREHATSPATFLENLEEVCTAVIGSGAVQRDPNGIVAKPCGRVAKNIYLTPDYGKGPYLDISVMPDFNALREELALKVEEEKKYLRCWRDAMLRRAESLLNEDPVRSITPVSWDTQRLEWLAEYKKGNE